MKTREHICHPVRFILSVIGATGLFGCGFFLAVMILFGPTIGPDDLTALEQNLVQLDRAKAAWAEAYGQMHSAPTAIEDVAPYLAGGRLPVRTFGETYHLGSLQQPSMAVLDRRVEYHNDGHTPEFALFPKGTLFWISDQGLVWSVPSG